MAYVGFTKKITQKQRAKLAEFFHQKIVEGQFGYQYIIRYDGWGKDKKPAKLEVYGPFGYVTPEQIKAGVLDNIPLDFDGMLEAAKEQNLTIFYNDSKEYAKATFMEEGEVRGCEVEVNDDKDNDSERFIIGPVNTRTALEEFCTEYYKKIASLTRKIEKERDKIDSYEHIHLTHFCCQNIEDWRKNNEK